MAMNNRILRPRASGFNPKSISGLAQWLDAADATTLTLVSGAVSSWADKSGNSRNVAQTTANNRPTTTTINGKTAVLFDGSNDLMTFTGVSRTDETWIIAAAQSPHQTGDRAFVSDQGNGHGIGTVPSAVKLVDVSFGGFTEGVERLRVQYSATSTTPTGPLVVSVVRSSSGLYVFIDGTQRSSYVNGATYGTSPKATTIKAVGGYGSGTFNLSGWIGEVLCYDRALSASDRNQIEKYLGKKWGITVA
jgi:hypothetical protein